MLRQMQQQVETPQQLMEVQRRLLMSLQQTVVTQ
jgi:hypothetical protein